MIIKVVVACKDSNGAPEFFACRVSCTFEEREEGKHYTEAMDFAAVGRYTPYLAIDEDDAAFRFFLTFDWKNTPLTAV